MIDKKGSSTGIIWYTMPNPISKTPLPSPYAPWCSAVWNKKPPPLAIPHPIWKWMVKNAGKNHALINRNYVRSRGRALAPLKLRSTSWPQLEQARVNKANARRDLDRKKWKKNRPSEIKSNYVLMNGKMSKWFTVHNRHLVPGNPSCPRGTAWPCLPARLPACGPRSYLDELVSASWPAALAN